MTMNKSSSELKCLARGRLLGHYGLPMGAFLILLLIGTALEMFIGLAIPNNSAGVVLSFMAMLIVGIFLSLFQVGYSYLLLNLSRKKEAQLGDIFHVFKTLPDRAILLTVRLFVLYLASVLPFFFCFVWAIIRPQLLYLRIVCVLLLIVSMALILYFSITYSQVFLIYLDTPELSCSEIMQKSREMMGGNKVRYFYLILSFIGISLLGVLTLYIGFLWIIPYMGMTQVNFYRDLLGEF